MAATEASKDLLYAEKYGGTLLERKLQIAGRKKNEALGKPCPIPPSPVFSRVRKLLPELQAANEELKTRLQEEINIEEISDDYKGPVIEMDVTLVPHLDTSDSEASSESSGDSDGDDEDSGPSNGPDLLSPLSNNYHQQSRGRKRKLVEVIEEEGQSQSGEEDGK